MQQEQLSAVLQSFHHLINQHLTQSQAPGLAPQSTPKQVKALLPELGDFADGHSSQALLQLVQTYLDASVNTHHSHFMNQLWSGFSLPGYLGEALGAATNTSMYTFEVAPLATMIEKQIISQCQQLVGYPEAEGTLVPGASYGNMMALLLARNHAMAEAKALGNQQTCGGILFYRGPLLYTQSR